MFWYNSNAFKDTPIMFEIQDSINDHEFVRLKVYYQNADLLIIIYSIADRVSFEPINHYINYHEKYSTRKEIVPIVIVGNKCDLSDDRKVSYQEGLLLAKKFNAAFIEISAKSNTNISTLFHCGAEMCMTQGLLNLRVIKKRD